MSTLSNAWDLWVSACRKDKAADDPGTELFWVVFFFGIMVGTFFV